MDIKTIFLSIIFFISTLVACTDGSDSGSAIEPESVPVVASVWPDVAIWGQEMKISGSYLGSASVTLNGERIETTLQDEHEIRFKAPELQAGTYQLSIENILGESIHKLAFKKLLQAAQIEVNASHTCALQHDGTVMCWGHVYDKTLNKSVTTTPKTLTGLSEVIALSGYCALISNGTVNCWEYSIHNPLGFESLLMIDGLSDVTAIADGFNNRSTCALTSGGKVQCWGRNQFGQLGDGTTTDSISPVDVHGLSDAITIAGNYHHYCAVKNDGFVYCWGSNSGIRGSTSGQFGTYSGLYSTTPVKISHLTDVTSVSTGLEHNCAIRHDGNAYCWGRNVTGQLGNNTYTNSTIPVQVKGLNNVTAISVNWLTSCALDRSHDVYCWGNGSNSPRKILSDVSAISTENSKYCAIKSDSSVQCWGYDRAISESDTWYARLPVTITGLNNVEALTIGNEHRCALKDDNSVQCWGHNGYGQLGDGTTADSDSPVTVRGLDNAIAISTYRNRNCVLSSEGSVHCWGSGRGIDYSIDIPEKVENLNDAIAIAVGGHQDCALKSNGTVHCWGRKNYGEFSMVPWAVEGLNDVAAITAGDLHVCALKTGGIVLCWGSGPATYYDGGITDISAPRKVNGLSDIASISAGEYHTCSMAREGKVQCWGNLFDPFWDGNNLSADAWIDPKTVSNLNDVASIFSGSSQSCALTIDGSVKCWGSNEDGFGNRSNTVANTPTMVVSHLVDVKDLVTNGRNTCAVLQDGAVQCWGTNWSGELGLPWTSQTPHPPITLP